MIADVRRWTGCGEKILESAHVCVTIHHGKIRVVQLIAVEVDQRGADAQILRPHQSVDLTKDPHPQADGIFDPHTQ